MAEQDNEIDAGSEARRIVNRYLSELGWRGEYKRQMIRNLVPAVDMDTKIRQVNAMELDADEHFGAEVDRLQSERSNMSRSVLKEILKLLGKRNDLSFFGNRIIKRLKEELGWDQEQ